MDNNHRLSGMYYGNKKPFKIYKNYDIKMVELFCQPKTTKHKHADIMIYHEFYHGKYPKEFSIFLTITMKDGSRIGQKKYIKLKDLTINLKTKTITYKLNNYKHPEDDLIPFPNCKKLKKIVIHLTDQGKQKIEQILKIHAEEDDLWHKKPKKKSRKKSRKTSKKKSRKTLRKKSRKTSRKK